MGLVTSGRYYDHAIYLVNDVTQGILSASRYNYQPLTKEKSSDAETSPPNDIVFKDGTHLSDYDLD